MSKKNLFESYGDCNPLDYNGLWLRRDSENNFTFVSVDNSSWYRGDEIPMYMLNCGTIDTTADWINRDSVINYASLDSNISSDSMEYAREVLQYYGYADFNDSHNSNDIETKSRGKARKFINHFGIVIHRNVA